MENMICYERTNTSLKRHFVGKIFYANDPLPAPPPVVDHLVNRELTLIMGSRKKVNQPPLQRHG